MKIRHISTRFALLLAGAAVVPLIAYGIVFVVMIVVYVIAKIFIKEEEAAGPSPEEVLLTEIRDELRRRPV